ncbi:MAG: sigma-54-dependent Fis family transcriptional regulator [Candidatus Dadabacteria bacterium]|nr:MAG: sigma-54-dependent Fis family transcriptional regulator [Candidatus Dadabacteria bacterium]
MLGPAWHLEHAPDSAAALSWLAAHPADLVLVETHPGDPIAAELLGKLRRARPEADVLVLVPVGAVARAGTLLRAGAADFLTVPLSPDEVRARIGRLRELRLARRRLERLRALVGQTAGQTGMVAESPSMRVVWERIELFANAEAPVLVRGERGVGKQRVARSLHERSDRRTGPFVVLAAAEVPEDKIGPLLFGRTKRGFAGAPEREIGCIERAAGGTLVVKDVERLPLAVQARLRDALELGVFRPGGAGGELTADVRLVATTSADVDEAAKCGQFDRDFLCLIKGLEIPVAPLRERRQDILPLAQHFLSVARTEGAGRAVRLEPSTSRILLAYDWPGNVAELRRVIEGAAAVCPGEALRPEDLPHSLRERVRRGQPPFVLHLEGCNEVDFHQLVESFQRELLEWALRHAGGQQTKAAEILHIPRTTLQSKLWKTFKKHPAA